MRRIGQWRVGLGWYMLALLLPLALTNLAVGLNLLLGARIAATDRMPSLADLPIIFLSIMVYIGLGEEPAWRGFALPRWLLAEPDARQPRRARAVADDVEELAILAVVVRPIPNRHCAHE